MGIPSFYKRITKKFPKCIKQSKDMGGAMKLFFDFNGLIHTVVNESEQYELHNNKILFRKIVQYYEFIVEFIKPVFIMVAIDGVCPKAKMIQQRIRRYKSGKDRTDPNAFDRNAISPGTYWMYELCLYLETYFKGKDVIFYGANHPGEGEHTIYKYIREDEEKMDTRYIVYGLDADLIMLSFVAGKNDIYLLRERQSFDKEYVEDKRTFNFLDINELKRGIIMFTEVENDVKIKNVQQYLDDFVFFTFLLGNDFVPHMNSLSINNNGIEMLIKHYIEMRKRTNSNLVSRKYMRINTKALCSMLQKVVEKENDLVRENSRKIHMRKDEQLNYYHKRWKQNYYYHFFNTDTKSYVQDVCKSYSEILKWTFKYYFEGCSTWRFSYNFRSAPCLSDVFDYLVNNDLNDIHFDVDEPFTSNQQLMMILPPKSRQLFPQEYVRLIDNELAEFYPRDFLLEVVDKPVDWMYTPIIPVIDDKMILEYVRD